MFDWLSSKSSKYQRNSSQDRNLQGTVEQIPDDPVLEKAEQLVEVPETISRNGVPAADCGADR